MQEPSDSWKQAMQEAAAATAASPDEVARVRARLDTAARGGAGAGAGWWIALAGAGVVAVVVGGLALVPDGGEAPDVDAMASFDGEGDARLQGDRLHIEWVVGTVTAQSGIDTTIETAEARWRGHDGGAVSRDRLGTHGDASLDCIGEAEQTSTGTTCLPTSPSGWLGRGHALGSGEAAQHAYQQAAEHGSGLVRAEAYAALADDFTHAQDFRSAAGAAEQALATGVSPRAEHLHRLAARAYLLVEDCAAALPHLQALPALTDDEAAYAARCAQTP